MWQKFIFQLPGLIPDTEIVIFWKKMSQPLVSTLIDQDEIRSSRVLLVNKYMAMLNKIKKNLLLKIFPGHLTLKTINIKKVQ